jgi:bifunctional non-homologous end joining protein LigD
MQPMLVESIRPGDWIYEIKFDGYRAVALRSGNETRILSRNETFKVYRSKSGRQSWKPR